jgi:hypothetical protein
MPGKKKSPALFTIQQVQTIALKQAYEHLLDTVYIYTNLFVTEQPVTRDYEEKCLADMINARAYLDSIIASTV